MTAPARQELCARRLSVVPEPIAIARSFVALGLPHVALLHAAEAPSFGAHRSFVAALPDRESRALEPSLDDDVPLAVGSLAEAPRWIGVVPYEAQRARLERAAYVDAERRPEPLAARTEWRRYPAVVSIDHATGEVLGIGTSHDAIDQLARALGGRLADVGPIAGDVRDADLPAQHRARVERAIELIRAGDLYQVNVARRLDVAFEGAPLDVYSAMASRSPGAFGGALEVSDGTWVLSTSPELLLRVESPASVLRRMYTEPIKGTRPRGVDARADTRLGRELDRDPKEIAELAMIVDVERNDLGSVARLGSVQIARAPAVVRHRTLYHRKSLLTAAARPEASTAELLLAMVPSGSVTGAPKIRAMEVIAALEAHRRGLYTGGFGAVAHDGSVTLAMAIRTLVACRGAGREHRGDYFTGGGIVVGSDPERELAETVWKARQLEALVRRA